MAAKKLVLGASGFLRSQPAPTPDAIVAAAHFFRRSRRTAEEAR